MTLERFARATAGRFEIVHGQLATVQLADGTRELRWGLLPPWRGHGGKRGPMVHAAMLETIAATPFLRNARTKRRCLVLADGFFAWHERSSRKQPYWIRAPHEAAFAGISTTNADDGIESFAIVCVPAAPLVAPVTDAMPAVVDDRWLAAPELALLALDGWRAAPFGNPAQQELF